MIIQDDPGSPGHTQSSFSDGFHLSFRRSVTGAYDMQRRDCATRRHLARAVRWTLTIALAAAMSGCGLAALPCRIGAATLKIVPVAGHAAAAPLDACASAID